MITKTVTEGQDFKVVHQSLLGNLSSYLADNCRLIADARE